MHLTPALQQLHATLWPKPPRCKCGGLLNCEKVPADDPVSGDGFETGRTVNEWRCLKCKEGFESC